MIGIVGHQIYHQVLHQAKNNIYDQLSGLEVSYRGQLDSSVRFDIDDMVWDCLYDELTYTEVNEELS